MRLIASFIAISTLMGCSKKENTRSANSGQNSSTETTDPMDPADGTTTVAPADATGTIAPTEETTIVADAQETTTVAAVEETTAAAATTAAPVTNPGPSGDERGNVEPPSRYVPPQTTITSRTVRGDALLAEIALGHASWYRLSELIADSVLAFPETVPALERWNLANGPALLRIAQYNLDTRPVYIKPLLILVGHIWQIPGFVPERFLDESGLRDFFTPANIATIQRFIVNNQGASAIPENAPQMLIQAYVAPLVAVMPSLMSSAELRHIVFKHRMLSHRFGVASPRNNPTFRISRATAFTDSVNTLLGGEIQRCTGVKRVEFIYASGRGMGVVREWFTEVSLQIYNPMYGLFKLRDSEQPNYMEVSPFGVHHPNHEQLYRAVGRFMGLALIQGNPIGLTFPIIFYARILGTEVTLEEVEGDEPALFNSMTDIRSFTTDAELADYRITIDGVSSAVTVENRNDLIRRKVNSLIDPAVEQSLNLIIAAFREMIPVTVTEGFTARHLRDLIVGSSTFEVEDLMANAAFEGGYTRESLQITWLESFLREMGPEERGRFLRFCTGSTQVPIGGFAALFYRFTIAKHGSPTRLPTSATCFNKLKLPPYESAEQLRRMVGMALNAPPFGR